MSVIDILEYFLEEYNVHSLDIALGLYYELTSDLGSRIDTCTYEMLSEWCEDNIYHRPEKELS